MAATSPPRCGEMEEAAAQPLVFGDSALYTRGASRSRHARSRIQMSDEPFKSCQCRTCGYVYDEEAGAPDQGLAPGTRWADIPDDWVCPECGTPKSEFDMVEL